MKIWLIKDIEHEIILDDLNGAINKELIKANIRTYQGDPARFADKRYHPNGSKVALPLDINRIPEWSQYISKHINETDLEELTEDWSEQNPGNE